MIKSMRQDYENDKDEVMMTRGASFMRISRINRRLMDVPSFAAVVQTHTSDGVCGGHRDDHGSEREEPQGEAGGGGEGEGSVERRFDR